MSICKRCVRNGMKREGGDLGVCPQHRRTKCLICRQPSLGEEMCAVHAHQVELMRWQAKAQLRIVDPDDQIDALEIRYSKLQESKFLAHEAVEIFFRAMHGAVQAVWGSPTVEPEPADEKREAA